MKDQKSIVWLEEVGKEDLGLVGGKGANLGEMVRAGIPVPPAFVVTSHAYWYFLQEAGLEPQLRHLLRYLNPNHPVLLQETSRLIKEDITRAKMPASLARDIREAYGRLGSGPVAVRSSATAEDIPEASFAGQQATFLNVEGEDRVVEAVQACWASLFEARAIFYRAQGGFDHLSVRIAVPVQRMVQSEASGVMFTIEPVSSDPHRMAIEAVFGLGEAIVSGAVSPDIYLLDKETLRIREKKLARQDWKLCRAASADHSEPNSKVPIPSDLQGQQKLPDDRIVELAKLGKRLESHYASPQDIEWALENGKLYIVQTRPVTTMKATPRGAEVTLDAPVLFTASPASPGVGSGPVRIVLSPKELGKVGQGDVMVAEMTTPDYVPAMLRASAIVTDRGGRTCHAAIVSRELGIPCVVGTEHATRTLKDGREITVDGGSGKVYDGRHELQDVASRRSGPAVRTRTRVYVNLAVPDLAPAIAARDVDGVGLLRAEFIIANQIKEHPRYMIQQGRAGEFTDKLAAGVEVFARSFHPRPVVYRTTDFKTNEYRNLVGGDQFERVEENPMLGYRGVSRYITEIDVFRLEIEAIKKVRRRYNNLWVMLPFVRTVGELAVCKAIMEREGLRFGDDCKLWMMAEVPSNILLLEDFISVGIDGISIGSNDLTQLTLGVDRDNQGLANLFDERDPAVVLSIEKVIQMCNRHHVTASICGQAPSVYPDLTEKLVKWGITSVSVAPDVIEVTRDLIARAEGTL